MDREAKQVRLSDEKIRLLNELRNVNVSDIPEEMVRHLDPSEPGLYANRKERRKAAKMRRAA
jgi:hypothetical protein